MYGGRATLGGELGAVNWGSILKIVETVGNTATGVAQGATRPVIVNQPMQQQLPTQQYLNVKAPQPKSNTLLFVGITAGVIIVGSVITYLMVKK